MRRLLISNIAHFADDYVQKMETAHPRIKTSLQKLYNGINTYEPAGPLKQNALNYLQMLINSYPQILKAVPGSRQEVLFDNYGGAVNGYDVIKKEYVYGIKPNGSPSKGELGKLIITRMQYEDARIIIGQIHAQMGLQTCVYCNATATQSTKAGSIFYQMDHVLPQSKFPCFVTNFYNLVPACDFCNERKDNNDSPFNLYTDNSLLEKSPYLFIPQMKNLGANYDDECYGINFVAETGMATSESNTHNKKFQIEIKYSTYLQKVMDVYHKASYIQPTAIKALKQTFPNINIDVADFIRTIMDFPLDEHLIHREPLIKLKQDTIRQLKRNKLIPQWLSW